MEATATEGDAPQLDEVQAAAERAERTLATYRDDPDLLATLARGRYFEGLRRHVERADAASAARDAERDRVRPVPVERRAELQSTWPTLGVAEQRQLLGLVFDAVFLEPGRAPITERLHLCLRSEAPDDMPRRGRKGAAAIRPFTPPHADRSA